MGPISGPETSWEYDCARRNNAKCVLGMAIASSMKMITYVIGVLLYLISDAPGQFHSASPGEEKLSLILFDDLQDIALSIEGVTEGKKQAYYQLEGKN